MTPNERTPYIGRVGGGLRARRPTDDATAAAPAPPAAVDNPLLEPGPSGGGIEPPQPDIGSVAFWRRIVAFGLDALVVFWLQFALTRKHFLICFRRAIEWEIVFQFVSVPPSQRELT
jgi:hypothetical protein